jgi:hypothetical protein
MRHACNDRWVVPITQKEGNEAVLGSMIEQAARVSGKVSLPLASLIV